LLNVSGSEQAVRGYTRRSAHKKRGFQLTLKSPFYVRLPTMPLD
jgi:hypothetical protein